VRAMPSCLAVASGGRGSTGHGVLLPGRRFCSGWSAGGECLCLSTTSKAKATWAMPAGVSLTSSESVRRLRARWEAPPQQELAALVLERLVFGGSFDDLGLGRVEGRVDLRGFQAPPPRRLREFRVARSRDYGARRAGRGRRRDLAVAVVIVQKVIQLIGG
jgi:hypothetical protein